MIAEKKGSTTVKNFFIHLIVAFALILAPAAATRLYLEDRS